MSENSYEPHADDRRVQEAKTIKMETNGATHDVSYEERIARKKRVVNELLALRRMKHMQRKTNQFPKNERNHSPTTGRVYEAYKVPQETWGYETRVTVSRDQVRGLMRGNVLEQELTTTYGAKAVEDAADSYLKGLSDVETYTQDSYRHDERFADVAQRRLFLHKLMKERKLKLEAIRQKRSDKEQELLKQKASLRIAKIRLRETENDGSETERNIESDSSDENVNVLVNEVKQNIVGLEKRIIQLKQKQRTEKKAKIVFKKPPAIDYEFKPWQEEQVKIATEIVDDVVKRALDICIYTEDNMGSKLLEALLITDNEAWERASKEEIKRDAMLNILNEIEEEVTSVIVRKVAEEFAFMTKMITVASSDLVINSPYVALHGKPPKETKDAAAQLIDNIWVDMVSYRTRARRNIWSHTQSVVATIVPSVTTVTQQPQQVAVVEDNEGDVTPLSYEQTPLTGSESSGEVWDKYTQAEFTHWESSDVTLTPSAFSLSYRKIIGVSCLTISYDNRYIALGSHHGDILVYDISWQPFRPIRCVSYVGKTAEGIIQIAMTFDRSRILTLSDSQCLILWSISFPSPSSAADLRHLGIPEEKDASYHCQQLTALAILEAKSGDFGFTEGPLATTISQDSLSTPVVAKFSPVSNILGTQDILIVGFASGNILKIGLSLVVASRMSALLDYIPNKTDSPYVIGNKAFSKSNKIADGIEVELFRSHQSPILMLHFVKNMDEMVSIDQKMNINIWRHHKDQFTGFNWYTPYRKLRLTGSEVLMSPKSEERLIFEDEITLKKAKRGKKRKGKQVIEQERREAQMELRALQLQFRRPWHSDDRDIDEDEVKKKKNSKFVTKTYAPTQKEILDLSADQLFHIVTKQRSTNLLVKYATRVYAVSSHICRALIGLQPNSDGRKLYFMFLYEKQPPNVKAHITFVDLDLTRLDMLQSMVIKVNLDQNEFDDVTINRHATFAVTRQYAFPKSEYIYCTIAGKMHAFSTDTGSEVAWCAPDKKSKKSAPDDGLEFPSKLGKTDRKVKLAVLCPDGSKSTHIIVQNQPESRSAESVTSMFTVINNATAEEKNSLHLLNKQLKEAQDASSAQEEEGTPSEQLVYEQRYTTREMPTELYIQLTLNSIVDNAVAAVTGARMTSEQRVKLWAKDWEKMQNFFTSTH